jgi:hypothetical protein
MPQLFCACFVPHKYLNKSLQQYFMNSIYCEMTPEIRNSGVKEDIY